MSTDFETVMAALFAHIVAAVQIDFTGDAVSGDATLTSVSSLENLFPGLPVFGPGAASGAVIQSLDTIAGTLTLSEPLSATATGASFATGFQTTGRRVKHWQQVPDQPAFFLRRTGTTDLYSGEMPIVTLDCEAWIYSRAGDDPDAIPDVALSNLDRLVRQSMQPGPTDEMRFTLGGLVYWCRIEGRSDYSPGDQAGQGISRIPVRITLPF